MVGFDTSIKNPNQDPKLTDPIDPFELSVPDLPFLDTLPDFDWSSDWIMDSDSFNNTPIQEENPVSNCSDLAVDFASSEKLLDSSNQDAVQKPIQENSTEVPGETPFVEGSDGNMVEGMGKEEPILGSLIEKEMEKVSLVGGIESSDHAGKNWMSLISKCLVELKPTTNGDEGNEGSLVVDCVSGLKLKENENGANEVAFGAFGGESENGLKLKEKGDGIKDVALVSSTGNVDDVTTGSQAQTKEKVSESDESDSSSGSDSESDSNDSESESDSDSSSALYSSSEEEDEEEKEEDKDKEIDEVGEIEEGEIPELDEGMLIGSDEDDEGAVKGPIKSKNETEVLPPVPAVNVTLEPHHRALPVGVILSIMGAMVVVEGLEKHNPLSEGSILWITQTRSPLGLVDEIFGPVKNPYYIVRYNSDQDIPAGIHGGTPVSFVAEFADYVLNDNNLYKKGYDASGEHDEELLEEAEFSDDEKESEYRRAQRATNNGGNKKKRGNRDSSNRNKVQHKGTSWKNGNPPHQPFVAPMGPPSKSPNMGLASNSPSIGPSPNTGHPSYNPNMGHQSYIPNQFHTPPVEAPFGCGNSPFTCGIRPDCVNGSASAPPPSQVAQANSCTPQNLMPPNGGWMNGMAFQQQQQQQQHMFFPNGFQMNGMPPQQQHPAQMFNGFPNGMQIQQQFGPNQMLLPNGALPYGQQNFSPSWSGPMGGQAAGQQVQLGMGFQGNSMHASQNGGGFSIGSFNAQSNQMQPSSNSRGNQGKFSAQPQNVRGRGPYGRGGNLSGRRGR